MLKKVDGITAELDAKSARRINALAEFRGESPEVTAAWLLEQVLADPGGPALQTPPEDDDDRDLRSLAYLLRLNDRQAQKLARLAELREEPITTTARRIASNTIRRTIPGMIREDEFVRGLDIEETELVNFFAARIKLKNGREFHSFPSRTKFIHLYNLFQDRIDPAFKPETYVLGSDLINRYYWRGAKHAWLPGPGGVIVEAGAYTGFKAVRYADIVGETGRVIAIEIDRDNYDFLVKNIEVNDLHEVITPVWAGIWNERGEAENRYMGRSRHTLAHTDQHTYADRNIVPTDTLDNILDDADVGTVDYLNLQVNGAEVEALDGLQRRFNDVKVFRIASYYSHGSEVKADIVCEMLVERGCRIISRSDVGSITAVTRPFIDQIRDDGAGFRDA